MNSAYRMIPEVLERLNMSELMEVDYDDSMDHGELVKQLVVLLCRQMEMDDAFIDRIANAAILHDIGKLKLSKNLYGRDKQALHVEEVKYMRMHTKMGLEMLKDYEFDEEILDAVYHHHENYDGSGYPDNLAGDRISLMARIIRVCDAFAALISDRPYRKAFDMDTAVEMMIEDVKTFDMEIFLEFLKLYHSEQFRLVEDFSRQINAKQRYIRKELTSA